MAKKKPAVIDPEPEVKLDFESRVRTEFYTSKLPYGPSTEAKVAYSNDNDLLNAQFFIDFNAYLIENGVPEKFAPKVASYAWQQGHSYGYYEVLNCAYGLIDIFRE